MHYALSLMSLLYFDNKIEVISDDVLSEKLALPEEIESSLEFPKVGKKTHLQWTY